MKNEKLRCHAARDGSEQDALSSRSMDFAVKVIELAKLLRQKQEYIVSSQLGRSGTSIGANIREAQFAQSKSDFIFKLQIALKEANGSRYCLELLRRTDYLDPRQHQALDELCASLVSMLVASIKTAKRSDPSAKPTP